MRQKGSVPSGQYADLTLEWNRPKDRTTANGVDSCIDTYNVQIIRVSDVMAAAGGRGRGA